MALHEVSLKGYNVRPGNLSLGTFGSYGIEQLHVTLDPIKRITDLEDATASQT